MKTVFVGALLVASVVQGCAFWEKAGPVIKTIADIALDACLASAHANEEQLGMTPREYCQIANNFLPFRQAQEEAAMSAGGELGLKVVAE